MLLNQYSVRQRVFSLSGHNCLQFLDQHILLTHDHQVQSRLQARAHIFKLIGKACLQLQRTILDGKCLLQCWDAFSCRTG